MEKTSIQIITLTAKTLMLFVASLYLFGYAVFPLIGIGNYALANNLSSYTTSFLGYTVDCFLISEIGLSVALSVVFMVWCFKCFFELTRKVRSVK